LYGYFCRRERLLEDLFDCWRVDVKFKVAGIMANIASPSSSKVDS
jgi:hypothetical protein